MVEYLGTVLHLQIEPAHFYNFDHPHRCCIRCSQYIWALPTLHTCTTHSFRWIRRQHFAPKRFISWKVVWARDLHSCKGSRNRGHTHNIQSSISPMLMVLKIPFHLELKRPAMYETRLISLGTGFQVLYQTESPALVTNSWWQSHLSRDKWRATCKTQQKETENMIEKVHN